VYTALINGLGWWQRLIAFSLRKSRVKKNVSDAKFISNYNNFYVCIFLFLDLPLKCDLDNGWDDLGTQYCYKYFSDKVTLNDAT
jgi:hypothetical protein